MNEMTEIDKAYLAGFFDGEGCISISKYQGKANRTPKYGMVVVLAQKGDQPMFEFQRKTGLGKIFGRYAHTGTYEWRMNVTDAKEFLSAVLPYLRNKKPEAIVALEFAETHNRSSIRGKGKGRGYTIPDEVVQKKERYYNLLGSMKQVSGKRGRPRKEI